MLSECQFYFDHHAYRQALSYYLQLLAISPALEDIHQQVIRIRKQLGEFTAMVEQFNECKRILDDYGVPLSAETIKLFKEWTT